MGEMVIDDAGDDDGEARIKPARKRAAPVATVTSARILLEENDLIPPTGLPVGLNGTAYLLQPGVEMSVPVGVIEILDHAVMSAPVVDPQTKQILNYRDRLRYPYRRLAA